MTTIKFSGSILNAPKSIIRYGKQWNQSEMGTTTSVEANKMKRHWEKKHPWTSYMVVKLIYEGSPTGARAPVERKFYMLYERRRDA
jgi:hypothetical protein